MRVGTGYEAGLRGGPLSRSGSGEEPDLDFSILAMLLDSRARHLGLPSRDRNGLYWRQRPSVARGTNVARSLHSRSVHSLPR